MLAWTHSIPEFVLQASAFLSPSTVANQGLPVTLMRDQNTVINTLVRGPKFHRLAKP